MADPFGHDPTESEINMLLSNEEQSAFRPTVVRFAQPYILDNVAPARSAVWKLAEDHCGVPPFLTTREDHVAADNRLAAHAFFAWRVLKDIGFALGNLG